MRINKKLVIILVLPIILIGIYGLTYIPQKIISIDAANVSKITIFNGNSGEQMEITDASEIDYLIQNLNQVTFQKGKWSFRYMGYSFRTTIYNKKGRAIKELIINTENTIRYKGFFYTAKDQFIDYGYIQKMFEK